MSHSATSSERRRRGLWLALLLAAAAPAAGQQLSPEEALRLAFPAPAQVRRQTAYLDEAQLRAVRQLAGPDVEVTQRVVSYYVAERDGRVAGVGYFDSHRVRTLPEVLLVVVDTLARVQRVEVVRFAEPPDYRAPGGWLARLHGRALDPALSVRRGVVNLSGATLTANAVTRAVRRVLALHAVLRPLDGGR